MKYWTIDKETREIVGSGTADKWNIPRNALLVEPLEVKDGYAVIANEDLSDSEYIEDHRDCVIYDKSDCSVSEIVTKLGTIKEGFTLEKPSTRFDEWIDGAWVTNESNKYIVEYNHVDDARRAAYFQMVTPLIDEAKIKRDLIKTPESIAEADELEQQALAARQKIQTENPWPTPPTN